MNFDNFFKNMWRFSGIDPSQEESQFPDGDEEEARIPDSFQDHFRSFSDESEVMRNHFERQFEFIFKSFGFMDFGGNFGNSLAEHPPNATLRDRLFKEDEQLPETSTLRDKLLKEPDSEKQIFTIPKGGPRYERPQGWFSGLFNRRPFVDEDLDEVVSSHGMDHLLKLPPTEMEPKFESRSFYSKSSVTIMSPDGKIEQRFSERDQYGNKRTVVKRQLRDKEHSITIKKDDKGVVQEENFVNLDDRDLEDFNQEWNTNQIPFLPGDRPDSFPIRDPSAPGIYQRLFGNFLPTTTDKN